MISLDLPQTLFNATQKRGILHIQMPSRLTICEADPFRDFFRNTLAQTQILSQIVLDFDQTQLMDSSGIGAFLSGLRYAQAREVPMISKNVGAEVMIVFSLTGLDQMLTIEVKNNTSDKAN